MAEVGQHLDGHDAPEGQPPVAVLAEAQQRERDGEPRQRDGGDPDDLLHEVYFHDHGHIVWGYVVGVVAPAVDGGTQ